MESLSPANPCLKALDGFLYHGFLSYSWKADYARARRLEAFLESLHRRISRGDREVCPLSICRDGSDFTLPRRVQTREEAPAAPVDRDAVWSIIEPELRRSKYLIVLCSPEAAQSAYVSREIDWFIEQRGSESILLVVTAGDPVAHPEECFPRAVLEHRLHEARIWYDLRGDARRAPAGVRDGEDERVRLAGDLLAWDPEQAGSSLFAIWEREESRRRRRQAAQFFGFGVALLVLGAAATVMALERNSAVTEREEAVRRAGEAVDREREANERAETEAAERVREARRAESEAQRAEREARRAVEANERAESEAAQRVLEAQRAEAAVRRERAALEMAEVRRREAERERGLSSARRLLQLANATREEDRRSDTEWPNLTQRALLLALEGARGLSPDSSASLEVEQALRGMLRELPRLESTIPIPGELEWAEFSGDGQHLLVIPRSGGARVWDLETGLQGDPIPLLPKREREALVHDDALSLLGELDREGGLRVWNAQTGQQLPSLSRTGAVVTAALSRGGTYLALADTSGTVQVIEASGGSEIGTFNIGREALQVAFAGNEQRLAVLEESGRVSVRRLPSLDIVQILSDPTIGELIKIAINEYGNVVSSISYSNLLVWNADTGDIMLQERIPLDEDALWHLNLSRNGESVSVYSYDGYPVGIWNVYSEEFIWPMISDHDQFSDYCLPYPLGGEEGDGRLGACVVEGGVEFWDLIRGEAISRVMIAPDSLHAFSAITGRVVAHTGSSHLRVYALNREGEDMQINAQGDVETFEWSRDASRIAIGFEDSSAVVWDADSGHRLFTQAEKALRFGMSQDGNQLALIEPSEVRLWMLGRDAADVHPVPLDSASLGDRVLNPFDPLARRTVSFGSLGKHLVVHAGETLRVWDTQRGDLVMPIRTGVRASDLCPDDRTLVTFERDDTLRVWDMESRGLQARIPLPPSHAEWASAGCTPGGRYLYAWHSGRVFLWEHGLWQAAHDVIPLDSLGAETVDFLAGDRYMMLARGADIIGGVESDAVEIWDLTRGERIDEPVPLDGQLAAWDVDPTRGFIAVAGPDTSVAGLYSVGLVSIQTGKVHGWISHPGQIYDVTFSPSGDRLAISGDDYFTRVWALPKGLSERERPPREVARIGHDEIPRLTRFSSDGRRLTTVENEGDRTVVRIWPLEREDLIQRLRQHVKRELHPEERDRFLGGVP